MIAVTCYVAEEFLFQTPVVRFTPDQPIIFESGLPFLDQAFQARHGRIHDGVAYQSGLAECSFCGGVRVCIVLPNWTSCIASHSHSQATDSHSHSGASNADPIDGAPRALGRRAQATALLQLWRMKVGFFLHSPCAAHCEQPVLASEQRAVAHVPHDGAVLLHERRVARDSPCDAQSPVLASSTHDASPIGAGASAAATTAAAARGVVAARRALGDPARRGGLGRVGARAPVGHAQAAPTPLNAEIRAWGDITGSSFGPGASAARRQPVPGRGGEEAEHRHAAGTQPSEKQTDDGSARGAPRAAPCRRAVKEGCGARAASRRTRHRERSTQRAVRETPFSWREL